MRLVCVTFLATFLADFAWARYTAGIAEKRALKAAGWSAAIIGLGAFSVVAYTTDHRMIVPAALGAFCGTLLAVRKGE